jgi:hypothetical protein
MAFGAPGAAFYLDKRPARSGFMTKSERRVVKNMRRAWDDPVERKMLCEKMKLKQTTMIMRSKKRKVSLVSVMWATNE